MTKKERPNVVGKGPAFTREMIALFREIKENTNGLSTEAAQQLGIKLGDKADELEKVVKMAYLKTVKAGEVAWDLKEMATSLKECVSAGDEAKATEIFGQMQGDLDTFIHKIKTFVVRMT
jgi:translation initiation factor 1 (eIF-1/SUI1)